MKFEELLTELYPINDKNNKIRKFIKDNFTKELLILYITELAIYMITSLKVSSASIIEKVVYDQNILCLSEKLKEEKEGLYKDDIEFQLEEDKEVIGVYFLKANEEVIAIVKEDIELYDELEKFLLN
ncbi:hypothetical protein [Romboutsia sp. 1001216sp1]|uniref:hypothetical protein n=1 Tax=Romboutsia sp. 1001216sp1 TaxID=2986997 RepID=UPI00232D3D59|nr:hypothetical protein [Romboutsia sp. 1001216sp1]MDB8804184.1 hypothetical protein [Romboutsia sp. 1001216sp1]MDB8808617.1 hypothetical protein [Romboutsia sp. 1001216sp1]MDB8809830.1 hypothetical protein [Romboutsia sp. 1001216sp1]MDB8815580.1 hypothetical protein [Romboutsia sp. 1001216sp1]MDB8820178.1 hypothetical protein [Romboutsia sp. 1001216sp1]